MWGYIQYHSGITGHAIIQVDKSGQNCIILHGGANQTITSVYHGSFLMKLKVKNLLVRLDMMQSRELC